MDLEREEEGAPPAAEADGDGGKLPPSPRDGWESVAALPAAEEDHGRGWEMVAAGRGASAYDDGCSVFPPSDHEGLRVEESFMAAPEGGAATGGVGSDPMAGPSSPPSSSSSSSSLSSISSSGGGREAWLRDRHEGGRKPLVELARRAVRSGCELLCLTLPRVRPRVGAGFCGVKHGAVWSSAAVAGLAAVLILCVRRRHQREKLRLLLLIQEKDQKISQLLLQIAQMNEVLSSRQRVPVVRTA